MSALVAQLLVHNSENSESAMAAPVARETAPCPKPADAVIPLISLPTCQMQGPPEVHPIVPTGIHRSLPCRPTVQWYRSRTVKPPVYASFPDHPSACILWMFCRKRGATRPTFHGLGENWSQPVAGILGGFSGLRPNKTTHLSPTTKRNPPFTQFFRLAVAACRLAFYHTN